MRWRPRLHAFCFACCASIIALAAEPPAAAPAGLRSQVTSDPSRPAQPGAVVLSYADVAAKTLPGVVTVIAIKYESQIPNPDAPKRLDLGRNAASSQVPQEIKGNGSGVIITRAGHILTSPLILRHQPPKTLPHAHLILPRHAGNFSSIA